MVAFFIHIKVTLLAGKQIFKISFHFSEGNIIKDLLYFGKCYMFRTYRGLINYINRGNILWFRN